MNPYIHDTRIILAFTHFFGNGTTADSVFYQKSRIALSGLAKERFPLLGCEKEVELKSSFILFSAAHCIQLSKYEASTDRGRQIFLESLRIFHAGSSGVYLVNKMLLLKHPDALRQCCVPCPDNYLLLEYHQSVNRLIRIRQHHLPASSVVTGI